MKIGILGATGEVGRMIITLLEERRIFVSQLELYASERSAGHSISYLDQQIVVKQITPEALESPFDYLLFSAGGKISLQYAPIAAEAGNTVIDNSSAFRRSRPLIVPEVNGLLVDNYTGIIANPNCSTIQVVLPLDIIQKMYGIEEIIISTYQSVSGAGHRGILALSSDSYRQSENNPFSRDIDYNVIPQIGDFDVDGNCEEESKMVYELKKILNAPDIKISVTTVRVPVFYGHSESVFIRCKNNISIPEIERQFLSKNYLEYKRNDYLTPKEIADSDQSHISRLRKGPDDKSLLFWNVAHNVRLGAATNAANIMQYLIEHRRKQ